MVGILTRAHVLEGLTVMQLARKVKDDTPLFVYLAAMSSTVPFASTALALHWHSHRAVISVFSHALFRRLELMSRTCII